MAFFYGAYTVPISEKSVWTVMLAKLLILLVPLPGSNGGPPNPQSGALTN